MYMREMYVMIFFFNLIHGKFYLVAADYFQMNVNVNIRQTRLFNQNLVMKIPKSRTHLFKAWVSIRGCYSWNALPDCLRTIEPVNNLNGKIDVLFKKKLKEYLCEKLKHDYLDFQYMHLEIVLYLSPLYFGLTIPINYYYNYLLNRI